MNQPAKHSGYPTPDENRIEELLSNIQSTTPSKAFYTRMQTAPWRVVQTKRNAPMKTKFAFSALATLLIMIATIAFVPPVRAQVAGWFTVAFRGPDNPNMVISVNGEGQPMKYQVMQTSYLPEALRNGVETHTLGDVSEMFYQTDGKFLVITQQAVANGETLPEGDAVTVNGQPAVLNKGLSGSYKQSVPPGAQISSPVGGVASSGGGGIGDQTGNHPSITTNQNTAVEPINLEYKDAAKLTFFIGNTKIEMLSNLDVEELLKIAEALTPAQ
jgi:hypothetical protein